MLNVSCTPPFSRSLAGLSADSYRYTHIEVVGQDDRRMLQKWRASRAARLIRLRATLRVRPRIAAMVKTLRVTDPHIPLYLPNDDPNPEYDAYLCTLASVIMACPNLEALLGFMPFYNHTFDRLTHALSTRTKLRQHVWIIAENEDVRERSQRQLPPGLLDSQQTFEFMLYHDRWQQLETLMLCSPGGLGVVEHELFVEVLHALPSLKNLCVSSFDVDDFNDRTLLSLPSLMSFRLEECLGVTDSGLTRWVGSPRAAMIERLSLIHQSVTNLLTLSKIFASLDNLTRFTLVQVDVIPEAPDDVSSVFFQPIMASKSLEYMHWDVVCSQERQESVTSEYTNSHQHHRYPEPNTAVSLTPNDHLALSIVHSGFPALTKLRAPRDTSPIGVLQSVCRPCLADLKRDAAQQALGRLSLENSLRSARLRAASIARASITEQSISNRVDQIEDPHGGVPSTDFENRRRSSEKEILGQDHGGREAVSERNGECCCEPIRESACICDDMAHRKTRDTILPPTPPPRSPLRTRFRSLNRRAPRISQRVSSRGSLGDSSRNTSTAPIHSDRPIFYLEPDLSGHDDNGGLIGWAELLGINEKAKSRGGRRQSTSTRKSFQRGVVQEVGNDGGEGEGEGEDEDGGVGMCTGAWTSRVRVHSTTESLDVVGGGGGSGGNSPVSFSPSASKEWKKWKLGTKGSKGTSSSQKSRSSLSLSSASNSNSRAELQQRRGIDGTRHVARPQGKKTTTTTTTKNRGGGGEYVMVDDFF